MNGVDVKQAITGFRAAALIDPFSSPHPRPKLELRWTLRRTPTVFQQKEAPKNEGLDAI
jgi:hypothetical protein